MTDASPVAIKALVERLNRGSDDWRTSMSLRNEAAVLLIALLNEREALGATREDYEAARESHLSHVRDLDVAMNGIGGVSRPLLIDIKQQLLDLIAAAKTKGREMKKAKVYWAGFVGDRIAIDRRDTGWGGYGNDGFREAPALFVTRREAREQFHDVRKVEIREVDA